MIRLKETPPTAFNVKVIHLVRDPRPTIMSRTSGRVKYSRSSGFSPDFEANIGHYEKLNIHKIISIIKKNLIIHLQVPLGQ